jgi:hypothetical protein
VYFRAVRSGRKDAYKPRPTFPNRKTDASSLGNDSNQSLCCVRMHLFRIRNNLVELIDKGLLIRLVPLAEYAIGSAFISHDDRYKDQGKDEHHGKRVRVAEVLSMVKLPAG